MCVERKRRCTRSLNYKTIVGSRVQPGDRYSTLGEEEHSGIRPVNERIVTCAFRPRRPSHTLRGRNNVVGTTRR